MPSLTIEELKDYSDINTEVFVETGTCHGDTVNNVLNYFDHLYSIELSPQLSDYSKNRFKHNSKVSIIQGDSTLVLHSICNTVEKPTFFWLDGHWSGGDTARGPVDCPLLDEVSIINKHFKTACIVTIDDVRLFGTHINEDWSEITREHVLNIVKDRLVSCKYFPSELYVEDRMVLHLKAL